MTEQTGTWEPNWKALADEWVDEYDARNMVERYRQQQAERGIVEMDRERAEHLDRLWRFVWFERACVKHHAFDLWGEALDAIRAELDALGEPPRLPNDADALAAATEQPNPDQAGTWEPDWDAITREAWRTSSPYVWNTLEAKRVIRAYRRQHAAQGMVEVSLDFLNRVKEMVDWLAEPCTAMGDDQAVYDELAALAAATEQDR